MDVLRYGTDEHQEMLSILNGMILDSQRFIENRSDDWDEIDSQNRLCMDLTKKRRNADRSRDAEKKELPFDGAIVIPVSRSVLTTRAVVIYSIMAQTQPFAHLQGVEGTDHYGARLLEACIERDFRLSNLPVQLWQLIINADKYSFGVWYADWREIFKEVEVQKYAQIPLLSGLIGLKNKYEKVQRVVKQWTNIESINPRRFLPDPSVPIGECARKGLYIGHSRDVNWLSLAERRKSEGRGPYFNVDIAKTASPNYKRDQGKTDFGSLSNTRSTLDTHYPDLEVHSIQMKLIPKNHKLSDSDRMEIWEFEVAGNKAIISAERVKNPLERFTYGVGQFEPDMHAPFTPGVGTDVIGGHNLINWLSNSTVANEKKILNDQLIVNDDLFVKADMESTSPGRRVRLSKKGKILHERGLMRLDDMYSQMRMTDITGQHLQTAQNIFSFVQRMASTPDTIQAMPLPTKRTLGEVQGISSQAGVALGVAAGLLDAQVVEPVVEIMVANRQSRMTMEEAVLVAGQRKAQQGAQAVMVDKYKIQGQYDYIPRTTTMPPDPSRNLSMWMQIMQMVTSGMLPVQQIFGKQLNLHKFVEEILFQMGINYFEEFLVDGQDVQQLGPEVSQAPGVSGMGGEMQAEVMSNEEIEKGINAGNMVPLS